MSTIEITPELEVKPDGATSAPRGPSGTRSSARKYLPYLIFTLCASLYFVPFMRLYLPGTDEGTLVEGALRTVHGQLLGRDFFEVIGPGTFYWLALFFKLFGVTFLASRICLFVTSLVTALCVYFLSRRVCRSHQWLPAVLLFGTYFATFWPEISHHVDSNCFALLAVTCMALWRGFRKSWLLLVAGALTGVTTLTLQPKGILMLLALLVWLWTQRRRESTPLGAVAWVASGWVGVVALTLSYFWRQGALTDLIYANVLWPSQNYGAVNTVHYALGLQDHFNHWIVPMHGVNWTVGMAAVLVVPFLFVAAIPLVVAGLGINHGIKNLRPEIVLYWLTGWALLLSEWHRKDITHLVFGSPLLIILCIFYLQHRNNKPFGLALQTLSITSVCLAACTLLVAMLAHSATTRVGLIKMAKSDPVLAAIDAHVPPGGELFTYPYSPMYYFFSATTNPTRYSFLIYNYYTVSQFQEVIQTLDKRRVKYVLWDKDVEKKIIGDLFPSERPKQLIIEPYLESHYKPVWTHDGILLMERNNDHLGN